MPDEITVILVDDHALLRETLRDRLSTEADINVVGCAANAEDGVTEVLRLRPDVVLMDIDMPGLVSFEAARTIKTQSPETRILFLSAFSHDRYIESALEVGATGYLTKDEPPEQVVRAVRQAAAGVAFFSSKVQARIVVGKRKVSLSPQNTTRSSRLTPREMEVLRYVAKGMTTKAIAQVMHLAPKTVEHHTMAVMARLDVHNRVELARFAIREGLAEA